MNLCVVWLGGGERKHLCEAQIFSNWVHTKFVSSKWRENIYVRPRYFPIGFTQNLSLQNGERTRWGLFFFGLLGNIAFSFIYIYIYISFDFLGVVLCVFFFSFFFYGFLGNVTSSLLLLFLQIFSFDFLGVVLCGCVCVWVFYYFIIFFIFSQK